MSLDEIDLAARTGDRDQGERRGAAVVEHVAARLLGPELIAWISQGCTLEPGDVILTGTPAGVGAARTPPRWLVDGDVVEITIEGVGHVSDGIRVSDGTAALG